MVPSHETPSPPPAHAVPWRGRSGRSYILRPVRLDAFALHPEALYVVARGNLVLWAGAREDVIQDAQSRARFRLALDCADRVFEVEAGADQVERMTAVWDLEGAEPLATRSAA